MKEIEFDLNNEADRRTVRAAFAFEQLDAAMQDRILDFLQGLIDSRELAS